MRKSKNRYIYHIFVSPGDAPGAITLNVVWMERESDAYKLSRCMCPSKYNRFWDTARYLWKKIGISSYPLAFDATVRGVPVAISAPLCYGKTRMVSLPDGEKISNISVRFGATHERDGQRQMDGHRVTALMYTHCVVIERDALCPRQLRIGGCEMKINYEAIVLASERTLLPWDRLKAAVGRL